MTDVINFIKEYWREVAYLTLLLIILLVSLVKKKVNVIDTIKGYVTEILPQLISKAEDKYGAGNGASKLEYVVQTTITLLMREFSLSSIQAIPYKAFIKKSAEAILSTPQKKER